MVDELILSTGIDVPFAEAGVSIHQPTIKELAWMQEEKNVWAACNLLTIKKEDLKISDKIDLSNQTNFDILMSIIGDEKSPESLEQRIKLEMLLTILFPFCSIKFTTMGILLIKEGDKELHRIAADNFDLLSEKIESIFCLKKKSKDDLNYNPGNAKAKELADKMIAARRKAAAQKGENIDKVNILTRYCSMLAIGLKEDINVINNYTIWQLFDQYERFSLKESNDLYVKEMLAGASGVEAPEAWTKDIHE